VTEKTFSWYSEQLENCQAQVEHLKAQLAEADVDRLVKQDEVERLRTKAAREHAIAERITEEFRKSSNEVERLRAELDEANERVAAYENWDGTRRDALEEK